MTPLLALAPLDLPVPKDLRFDGDGFGLPLSDFAPEDRAILREIYAAVHPLAEVWRGMRDAPDYAALRPHVERLDPAKIIGAAHRLGESSRSAGVTTQLLRMAVHDMRGGGLVVLANARDLLAMMPRPEAALRMAAHAAREHAKVMRNAVTDLDPERRREDKAPKPHSAAGVVAALDGAIMGKSRVTARCAFDGQTAGCCLEAAAIDRVLYSMVESASRFSDVTVDAFRAGDTVRYVVGNALAAGQLGDPLRLFRAEAALSACTEVVSACFRVGQEDALERGHLGARVVGGRYNAWFHWPVYRPA